VWLSTSPMALSGCLQCIMVNGARASRRLPQRYHVLAFHSTRTPGVCSVLSLTQRTQVIPFSPSASLKVDYFYSLVLDSCSDPQGIHPCWELAVQGKGVLKPAVRLCLRNYNCFLLHYHEGHISGQIEWTSGSDQINCFPSQSSGFLFSSIIS